MKRSRSIRLVLIGGLSAGALTGCGPMRASRRRSAPSNVYTNNYLRARRGLLSRAVSGLVSAALQSLRPRRPSAISTAANGGHRPHQSITNISAPTRGRGRSRRRPSARDIPRERFRQHLAVIIPSSPDATSPLPIPGPTGARRSRSVGLTYHSHEDGPYWDESACYELTRGRSERARSRRPTRCITSASRPPKR